MTNRIRFSGVKKGPDHYPGKMMPGCTVDDPDVDHWHATIGSAGWTLQSPEDVILHINDMLKDAYELGRKDQRDDFKERMGLK